MNDYVRYVISMTKGKMLNRKRFGMTLKMPYIG